jgi:hypothetical protein
MYQEGSREFKHHVDTYGPQKDFGYANFIPLIARKHPEMVSNMSIRLEGSVGLRLNDKLSDMEAMVLLPEDLWKARGGQLQLTLIHCLVPFSALPFCS